jgi:hypothetical protein
MCSRAQGFTWPMTVRASQFFITTEDAEDTENGHFTGIYGVFSVSSASSVVKNILLIIPAAYQKHCNALYDCINFVLG